MASRYRPRHDGPCLVAGAGPTVFDDVSEARRLFLDAPLYGANSACNLFGEIKHVWTQHAQWARDIKGFRPGVLVHARGRTFGDRHSRVTLSEADWDTLDYAWPELEWVNFVTSGMGAALWARHGLGHSTVVVCGVTLDRRHNTYAPGYPWPARGMGGTVWTDPGGETFEDWHAGVLALKSAGKCAGIYAMSGWPAEALGRPKG